MKPRAALLLATVSLAAACGGGPAGGATSNDAGVIPIGGSGDSGGSVAAPAPDAMTPDAVPATDASAPPRDAGPEPLMPPPASDAAAAAGPGAFIPKPRGVCPKFASGMITVRPTSSIARQARVWISDAAATKHGPLVFYWYGTNGAPAQAEQALGRDSIAAILDQGGVVVAPVHDPAAGIWPWFLVSGTQDFDLQVADELVACAVETVGVDTRRIHSVGFSAGAIQTAQMSYRRSGYIASVVTFSGAKPAGVPDQDPGNKFAALIFHGGVDDRVVVSFQDGSVMYKSELAAAGRFALICNHGLGHRIPPAAATSVWPFLRDHPFGLTPSPYVQSLPASVPPYCMR
jgi:predicted esterase